MIFASSFSPRRLETLITTIVVALAAIILSGSPANGAEFKTGQVISDFSLPNAET